MPRVIVDIQSTVLDLPSRDVVSEDSQHHTYIIPIALYRIPQPPKMCKAGTCTNCRTSRTFSIPSTSVANTNSTERASWWGCGKHIPDVMNRVPKDKWCTCEPTLWRGGTGYPPMAPKADWVPQWLCNMVGPGNKK